MLYAGQFNFLLSNCAHDYKVSHIQTCFGYPEWKRNAMELKLIFLDVYQLIFCIPYLEESKKQFVSPVLYASVARSFRTAVAAHKGWTVGKGMFVLDVIEVGS